jgi:hypothetical protein
VGQSVRGFNDAPGSEERTSRFRFCTGVSSGSVVTVDPRSRADTRRGVFSTVLFSRFIGCTGFAFCLGVGLGFAGTFDFVLGPVTDAEAFLRSSCSMSARLRAIFASRSSSLFSSLFSGSTTNK